MITALVRMKSGNWYKEENGNAPLKPITGTQAQHIWAWAYKYNMVKAVHGPDYDGEMTIDLHDASAVVDEALVELADQDRAQEDFLAGTIV